LKFDLLHPARLPAFHPAAVRRRGVALGQQQRDQVLGRSVAEELALVLLVEADAVPLQQRHEVLRREARQRRAAEVRVAADEMPVRRGRVERAVGEVGAPAAGDAHFFGHALGVVDQQHAQAALARLRGAEQAGGAGAEDDGVNLGHGRRPRRARRRPPP
jgi:hypothetical protein